MILTNEKSFEKLDNYLGLIDYNVGLSKAMNQLKLCVPIL